MTAQVTPIRTETERTLAEQLRAAPALAGNARFSERREAAILAFERNGLPSRRVEAWKYTDLRALMKQAPEAAGTPVEAELAAARRLPPVLSLADAVTIDIVNGAPQGVGQPIDGVTVLTLADAVARKHAALEHLGTAFEERQDVASGLNLAFMRDGLVIEVAEGRKVETPLHLAFAAVGTQAFAAFPRVLVVVGKGASLTLFESHRGDAGIAYQNNAVVEFVLGADAEVDHVRLDRGGDAALSLATLAVKLADNTRFESFNLICGPQVARYQIFTGGAGQHITLGLRGATLLRGQQHGDVTLHAIHAAPHGTSRELFKTIVDDEATGVFQGKIVVDAIAQKTDGRMHSAALMLAENAAMNNKPELEIFADDVQCAHGATVGELDQDLLFYAMSRGIARKEAEALLIESFIGEAAEFIAHEGARDAVMGEVVHWLRERAS
jgi:Fe-S cluster assembly protein SufD